MKLSDVMSHAGLAGYAEIALILFLLVFVAVAARTLWMRREDVDRLSRLPLDPHEDAREQEAHHV